MSVVVSDERPTEPKVVDHYVSEFKKSGRLAFKAWQAPVIIRADDYEDQEQRSFRTVVGGSPAANAPSRIKTAAPTNSSVVYLVVKRAQAAFQDRIGIGRAPNTDLYVPLPRLSKYHAYFDTDADGAYRVTDADSKNGTFADGVKLNSGESRVLRDGSQIRLGPYTFVFYGPQPFIALIAERAGR